MVLERRRYAGRFARLDVKSIAALRPLKNPSLQYSCLCSNISAHGARFIIKDLDKSLDLGDDIEISFYMPDGVKEIKATARVMWIKKEFDANRFPRQYEVGMEFLRIDPGDVEIIKNYILDELKRREAA